MFLLFLMFFVYPDVSADFTISGCLVRRGALELKDCQRAHIFGCHWDIDFLFIQCDRCDYPETHADQPK
jgi:hypothetical protein